MGLLVTMLWMVIAFGGLWIVGAFDNEERAYGEFGDDRAKD